MNSLFKTASKTLSVSRSLFQSSSRAWNSSKAGSSSFGSLGKISMVLVPVGLGAGYYFSSQSTPKIQDVPIVSSSPPISAAEFTPFTLKEIIAVTHDTNIYRFEIPGNQALHLPIASCIVTRKPPQEGEKPIIRPYTPVSHEDQVGYFDLMIKHYENGAMTSHIKTMKVGDILDVKGPFLKHLYKANTFNEIGLIAGGSGITPMLQLMRKILKNPQDKTKVSLLFANRTENDILLKKELDNYAKAHPEQFKVHYLLDTPPQNWTGIKGYVTKELLEKHLPSNKNPDNMIFVCGPPPMVKAISGLKKTAQDQGELGGMLKQLGYTKENVFKF